MRISRASTSGAVYRRRFTGVRSVRAAFGGAGRLNMARTRVGDILGSMREGLSDAGERGQDLARDVAERVEDVLDEAGVQGKRIRKELAHRWKAVDRVGRLPPVRELL